MKSTDEKNTRLTDNQRRTLTDLLKRYDKSLTALINKAKNTTEAVSASEKLSTNLDFKKKAISSFEKLRLTCIKQGVHLPVFDEAEKISMYHINNIIAGQPRQNVRWHIESARLAFFYRLLTDEKNINFKFNPAIE